MLVVTTRVHRTVKAFERRPTPPVWYVPGVLHRRLLDAGTLDAPTLM
jgi:hypothetical protein